MVAIVELIREIIPTRRNSPFFTEFEVRGIDSTLQSFRNQAQEATNQSDRVVLDYAVSYLKVTVKDIERLYEKQKKDKRSLGWRKYLYLDQNLMIDVWDTIASGRRLPPQESGVKLAHDELVIIKGIPEELVRRNFYQRGVEGMMRQGDALLRGREVLTRLDEYPLDWWMVPLRQDDTFLELYYRAGSRYPRRCAFFGPKEPLPEGGFTNL